MNKRFFSILMILMLVFISVAACAENVPSITINNTINAVNPVTSTGNELPAAFQITFSTTNATTVQAIEQVVELVSNAPVVTCFNAETVEAIAAKLPETVKPEDLKLNELTAMSVSGYDAACGDVSMTLSLTADYADDDNIVVLVGVLVDGEIVWYPLDAEIIDGNVSVTFTQDILTAAGEQDVLFALLREA